MLGDTAIVEIVIEMFVRRGDWEVPSKVVWWFGCLEALPVTTSMTSKCRQLEEVLHFVLMVVVCRLWPTVCMIVSNTPITHG